MFFKFDYKIYIYLNVPFSMKDKAKELKLLWNPSIKSWYYYIDCEDIYTVLEVNDTYLSKFFRPECYLFTLKNMSISESLDCYITLSRVAELYSKHYEFYKDKYDTIKLQKAIHKKLRGYFEVIEYKKRDNMTQLKKALSTKTVHHIYFKQPDNKYRVYNPYHKTYSTMTYNELIKLSRKYEMFKGYEPSDSGLLTYYNDFKTWNDELYKYYKKTKGNLTFYNFYYTNEYAVMETFNKYTKHLRFGKYTLDNLDDINGIEALYFEACNNGGLTYASPGTYNCYGYDFISFYPSVLGSSEFNLKLPLNGGREVKLKSLTKLNYGIYKVIIECDNEDFKKQFSFSKSNTYTHYSLAYAMKHQREYNIKIQLINDVEYNAYIYDESNLIDSTAIFGQWYNELMAFKREHPSNKLIKHLLSSLWGSLCKRKKIYVKEDELENYDWGTTKQNRKYICTDFSTEKDNEYYTLIDRDNQYEYNLRLKPFMLSYARNVMAEIIYNNNPSKVVRVFCDSIMYCEDVQPKSNSMIREDKSTGMFHIKNAITLTRLCPVCRLMIPRSGQCCCSMS